VLQSAVNMVESFKDGQNHEAELFGLRNYIAGEIVFTKNADHIYSNYLLVGEIGEKLRQPVAILGVFPTENGNELHFFGFEGAEDAKYYWEKVTSLELPKRARTIEECQYGENISQGKDILKEVNEQELIKSSAPSVIILFAKAGKSEDDSVYIFHHTAVPPSAALSEIKEEARALLPKIN